MNLNCYREERLNWKFTYSSDLKAIANSWKVTVLSGIQVYQPDNCWINEINKRLKIQGLVSYVVPYSIWEVKGRLQLPMHFEIYPMDEVGTDEKPPLCDRFWAIGFTSRHFSISFKKNKRGESWIC